LPTNRHTLSMHLISKNSFAGFGQSTSSLHLIKSVMKKYNIIMLPIKHINKRLCTS
jgi:hypothetical protein